MKKKVVAVLLSLTLCLTMGVQAGASAFSDGAGDFSSEVPADTWSPEETPEDNTELPPEITMPEDDVEVFDPDKENTDQEEPAVPETPVEPEVPVVPEIPAEPENPGEEDVFTPEVPTEEFSDSDNGFAMFSSEEDMTADAVEDVVTEVNRTDWEETESGKFKLHKTADTYYTAEDGIVYLKTVKDKSAADTDTDAHTGYAGYYFFDEEGHMATGRKIVDAENQYEHFFIWEGIAETYPEFEGEGAIDSAELPWKTNLGQMKKSFWLWEDEVFRFYDSTGKFLSVDRLKEIRTEKGDYTGYYKIDGGYYYLDESGAPLVGKQTIKEGTKPGKYYFLPAEKEGEIPGKMFKSGWQCHDTSKGDQWCYYKSDGRLYERGIVATRLDVSVMGNYAYLLSEDGYIIKNTVKKAGNGAYYAADSKGRVLKDKLVKYNGARYYFGKDGKRVTWSKSWHRCPGASNRFYYFSSSGKVSEKTGWQKVTSTSGKMYGWFYFSSKGNHYIDTWAQGGYFRPDGKLASGITEVDGKTYFFERSSSTVHKGKTYKSTFIKYNDKIYYATSDGTLAKSKWVKVNGNYYYFQKDFTAKTNTFATKGSTHGYLDSNGKFCTGWVVVNDAKNQVKYLNPKADGYVKNTSMVIDGLRYYFDKDGYRRNDLTDVYKGPYYVEVDRVNGVMTIFDANRTVPVKSIRVSVGRPETPTPLSYGGTYRMNSSLKWQPLMGPSWGQYGTHVVGAGQGGIFVHSVAGSAPNPFSLPGGEYNKLGNPASHGCIRACVADAKWVYEHCDEARIKIFDGVYTGYESRKGPLGRRPLVPLRGAGNFDPTDPAV